MLYNFTPVAPAEDSVFGACRPGHDRHSPPESTVDDWVGFMLEQGIERVCCLLSDTELSRYDDLLGAYRRAFGPARVCHAPVPDYQTVDRATYETVIRPFLDGAVAQESSVVVHCSAGSGRTGHVLVGWLVQRRGLGLDAALETVWETGRNPLEAATRDELAALYCQP